ncbi:hypothetical protein EVAR_46199_1 [Eumeta japonica]|uniref:Uncharacterized protein n=1 Tax=Eumeta variegata TaxID=151549 RepID=A0A4C1WDL0_EUMVA|nr:hypothetical protein EVAR_46199_1 [Eumeta japonica]
MSEGDHGPRSRRCVASRGKHTVGAAPAARKDSLVNAHGAARTHGTYPYPAASGIPDDVDGWRTRMSASGGHPKTGRRRRLR